MNKFMKNKFYKYKTHHQTYILQTYPHLNIKCFHFFFK